MEHEKEQNEDDLMASSVESDFISSKDIYLKLAQQVELIQLYNEINQQLLSDEPGR